MAPLTAHFLWYWVNNKSQDPQIVEFIENYILKIIPRKNKLCIKASYMKLLRAKGQTQRG